MVNEQFFVDPYSSVFTTVLGAFAIRFTVMLRTIKSNRVTTRLTLKVLEQEWLAVVLSLTDCTSVFDFLNLVP